MTRSTPDVPFPDVGRYRLHGVIGVGAFATVFHGVDDRLGDEVAVKVLAENHSLDLEVRERFVHEGRVLRRIDSPFVVRVHDAGETERQQPFLVLEHADRGTLAQRVRERRELGWRPSADDVRAVALPLASAVEAVHRAGVVHRDLNPSNVLLSSTVAPGASPCTLLEPDERLLVADLGLCKDLAVNSGLTVAGGTQGFRPPEQRGAPTTIDVRADLWALSALVLWLLSGVAPDGTAPLEVVRAAGLPPELATPLTRSLADDPDERHADVASWAAELDAALTPATSTSPGPVVAAPQAPVLGAAGGPRPRRARLVAFGLGLVLGVGGLLGGSVLLTGGAEVTELGDGQVRVARSDDGAEVALVGPDEVTVGATARFRAETSEVDAWVWLAPDGTVHADVPGLDVRTSSPGTAVVRLVGTTSAGRVVEVEHRLRVTTSP